MAQTNKIYSPGKVIVSFAGINLSGFSDGTFITLSREEENSTASVGADGTVGLTVSANKTGTAELVLMQTSESNQILSAIQAKQDKDQMLLRGPLVVTDPSGGFIAGTKNAHIQSTPDVSLGAEQEDKTWKFFAEDLSFGAVAVGVSIATDLDAKLQSALSKFDSDGLFGSE